MNISEDPYQFLNDLPQECIKELLDIELQKMKSETDEDVQVSFNIIDIPGTVFCAVYKLRRSFGLLGGFHHFTTLLAKTGYCIS